MADDRKKDYLLKSNGKPYRTADGEAVKLEGFDKDPTLNPGEYKRIEDMSDKEFADELKELGIPP